MNDEQSKSVKGDTEARIAMNPAIVADHGRTAGGSRRWGGGVASLVRFVHGRLLMAWLKLRHGGLVDSLAALAVHLEDDVFPASRESGGDRISIDALGDDQTAKLVGRCGDTDLQLPGLEEIAIALRERQIYRVNLDSELEFGQVVDAFLILLYATPLLQTVTPVAVIELPHGLFSRTGAAAKTFALVFKKRPPAAGNTCLMVEHRTNGNGCIV